MSDATAQLSMRLAPRVRLPLALSAAAHAAVLAMLIDLASEVPLPLDPPQQQNFAVALSGPAVPRETAHAIEPPPTEPEQTAAVTAEPEPATAVLPEPEAPVSAADAPAAPQPAVPVVTASEPPPVTPPAPIKPARQPPPKPVARPREPAPAPVLAQLPPAVAPRPSFAPTPAAVAVPAPVPAPRPDLAASYRAMLSYWFESHKRYPQSARERAEQGSAVVRFRVDRSGRVLDFGLLQSTGYADLDGGVADMLRGAQLPPFPPGLEISQLSVSVTLRFSLTR